MADLLTEIQNQIMLITFNRVEKHNAFDDALLKQLQTALDEANNHPDVRVIVLKANGAIVWGGGMELAPVDDKLIKIRHPLSLDPEGMLLASILGKKKSVGARYNNRPLSLP